MRNRRQPGKGTACPVFLPEFKPELHVFVQRRNFDEMCVLHPDHIEATYVTYPRHVISLPAASLHLSLLCCKHRKPSILSWLPRRWIMDEMGKLTLIFGSSSIKLKCHLVWYDSPGRRSCLHQLSLRRTAWGGGGWMGEIRGCHQGWRTKRAWPSGGKHWGGTMSGHR